MEDSSSKTGEIRKKRWVVWVIRFIKNSIPIDFDIINSLVKLRFKALQHFCVELWINTLSYCYFIKTPYVNGLSKNLLLFILCEYKFIKLLKNLGMAHKSIN